jgi:polysaccharide deacetylase family protein (PEP-CTERM system associated)
MHILSFDVEEWFHLLEHDAVRHETSWGNFERKLPRMLERILSMLEETGTKATFFCLGWVAREYPDLIREIDGAGHEIGSHSDVHTFIFEQTPDEFRKELRRSKDSLEQVAGKSVRAFRAPGFSLVPRCAWAFDVLAEEGFEVDCSIFPAHRAHGGFPGFGAAAPLRIQTASGELREFPMNTAEVGGIRLVFSGGGYFRLLPLPLLQRLWRRSGYTMTYFHPRDFEPEQKYLPGLGPLRRFKSYYGLREAEAKLRAILKEFTFETVASAEKQVDWADTPLVQLN